MDDLARNPWPKLAESLEASPVIRVQDYEYFVHALTDGVLPISADLLEEAVEGLRSLLPASFDVLLAPEAMGLPIATGLTLATGKPFLVARKRAYGLAGEVVAPYATGYAKGQLHVNGITKGQRVVLIDDVLSKGGTARALAKAVRQAGAQLVKVVLLVDKSHDLSALARDVGAPVEALFQIRIQDGRVQVTSQHAAPRLPA